MAGQRPNILLIVADDLGFSDVGCFGGEIETPNIDKLAAEGIRFSDFHSAPACSPTRSMIFSGTDNHLAGIGVMVEHRNQDPERWNLPGHEGYLNYDIAALTELLADEGYFNVMAGKWHLGYREPYIPSSRDFHKSYAFLPGAGNHFAWEPTWPEDEPATMKPPHVTGQSPRLYVKNGEKVVPEANKEDSPNGFFSSHSFADELVTFLKERTPAEKAKPFFGFLPFTAPHWPLQCFPEDRERYKGKYAEGPDVLRHKRLQNLKDLGLIRPDVKPHNVIAKTPEWDSMDPEQQALSARAMECYAGMVHAIDRASGKVMDFLRESGEWDNTLCIFMSDNGAEGQSFEAAPTINPSGLLGIIQKYYCNELDNLGNHDSYCWIGPRWAQASTAPNRLMKAFTTEGGIRVPFVVRYPKFTAYRPGSICHSFATCMDLLPTFLSLAGGTHPNPHPSHPREKAPYRNREVYGVRGKSWVPYLTSREMAITPSPAGPTDEWTDTTALHAEDDRPVGWEQLGRAALRQGKWKILYIPIGHPTGTGKWQLYDLSVDQGETNDLGEVYPDKLEEMKAMWSVHQAETGTVFGPPIKSTGRQALLPDQVGGDPIEDMKAWMGLGIGNKLPRNRGKEGLAA